MSRRGTSSVESCFSGRFPLAPDDKGRYFIDRDGTHFRHILNNHLRDPGSFKLGRALALEGDARAELAVVGSGRFLFIFNVHRAPRRYTDLLATSFIAF